MNRSRRSEVRRSAIGLLGVVLVACGGATAPVAQAPRPPRPVQLHTVATRPLPSTVAVTGVLAAQEELVLGLEVAGRLQTLTVDVGDVVAAGAELAALDPRDLQLAVRRAEAALAAAEARLGSGQELDLRKFDVETTASVREARALVAEARLQRDRIESMVQQNAQSGAELDTAAAALAVAESRLQRALDEARTNLAEVALRRVEREQAQKRAGDSRVVAPWPGRVAVRHVTAGQVVGTGAPIVTLLRIDPLRLQLRLPDRLAAEVAAGQQVEFTVDGGGDTVHRGRVVRQGAAIERGDRTRLCEAEVPNTDGVLLPGAFCRARITTAEAAPVIVVPSSAVASFAGVDRVFTVESAAAGAGAPGGGPPASGPPAAGPRAKGRIVELGRRLGDEVEVVKGLEAGLRIVRDATGLSPESPVAVVE